MAEINEWWRADPEERFWLEVTRRNDLGTNLKAPQTKENGTPFWGYSLINHVRSGDQVFHYDGNTQRIVARSVAVGEPWEDELMWAARGTSARSAGIQPHVRPGWYLGLEEFTSLTQPITLESVRERVSTLRSLTNSLREMHGGPLYFPFEIADRPLRPVQGYLFKLPREFVRLFDLDVVVPDSSPQSEGPSQEVTGGSYRRADESASVAERDPFSVDPALVERGVRGHACTQNKLADFLASIGVSPRSSTNLEPNFDIAWQYDERFYVAEVKSLTDQNEEKQMRLGLGQVLRYAHLMRLIDAVPVLVVEREPRDSSWIDLCTRLGVILVWPSILTGDSWPLPSPSVGTKENIP